MYIAEDDVVVLRLFGDVYVFIQKDGLVFLEEISAAHTFNKQAHTYNITEHTFLLF